MNKTIWRMWSNIQWSLSEVTVKHGMINKAIKHDMIYDIIVLKKSISQTGDIKYSIMSTCFKSISHMTSHTYHFFADEYVCLM